MPRWIRVAAATGGLMTLTRAGAFRPIAAALAKHSKPPSTRPTAALPGFDFLARTSLVGVYRPPSSMLSAPSRTRYT